MCTGSYLFDRTFITAHPPPCTTQDCSLCYRSPALSHTSSKAYQNQTVPIQIASQAPASNLRLPFSLFLIMASGKPNQTPTPTHPMAIRSVLNPEEEEDQQSHPRDRTVSMSASPSIDSREWSSSPDASPRLSQAGPQRTINNQRTTTGRAPFPSTRERREFRPTYQQEEERFIWYHRVDLGMDWGDLRNAYNAQFPHRQRTGFQGIQCKYYRCCESHGVPRVRHRDRTASMGRTYGLRARLPTVWYPWMRTGPIPGN